MTARVVEFDLDGNAPAGRRGSRVAVACAALALLGVVAGVCVAAAMTPARSASGPAVVAWVALTRTDLAPQPKATLELTMTNLGDQASSVGPLRPRGAGFVPRPTSLEPLGDAQAAGGGAVLVPPGATVRAFAVADLDCARPAQGVPPLGATVDVRRADGPDSPAGSPAGPATRTSTDVAPTGVLSLSGAACRAARQELPAGWDSALAVEGAAVVDGDLELRLAGVPGPPLRVVAMWADTALLTPRTPGRDITEGPVTLRAGPPQPVCEDVALRPRLPTGVQLVLMASQGSLTNAYVPVGPDVARWLAQAYERACPPASLVAVHGRGG